MSKVEKQLSPEQTEALKRFKDAMSLFIRVKGTVDSLPFPVSFHAECLVVIEPDLNEAEDISGANKLLNSIIVIDRQQQQEARAYLTECGAMDLIEQTMPKRKRAAFSADLVDLAILHRLAQTTSARQILELGSGLSTVVLGHAASTNGGHVTALEPDANWAEHTRTTLPECLLPHVSVIHSPGEVVRLRNMETRAFQIPSGVLPDLIYIDGAPEGARFQGLETVMQLEPDLKPGTVIVIDSRVVAVKALLGLSIEGKPIQRAQRMLRRTYAHFAQGMWVKPRNTNMPAGPFFGLDRFCITGAMLIE